MATVTYEIDRRDFENWLKTAGSHVFTWGDCTSCVMAKYLKEMIGTTLFVGREFFLLDGALEEPHPLPPWAKHFVDKADAYRVRRALDALAVLRSIPEDMD